jgi:phage shock protein A
MWRGRRRFPNPRDWLARLLAPAEDPRSRAAAGPAPLDHLLAEVTAARDRLTALRRELTARAAALPATLARLEEQAAGDLAAGDEPRARQALFLGQLTRRHQRALAGQEAALAREEQHLHLLIERLTLQQSALRTRQELAAAQADIAATQARVSAALAGLTAAMTDLAASLAHAERQADQTRAWAAALDDLAPLDALTAPGQPPGDSLAADLDRLELDQAIEAHLVALREAASRPVDPPRREPPPTS